MKTLKTPLLKLSLYASALLMAHLSPAEDTAGLEWGGIPADANGYVDTGDWLGWLSIQKEPWLWSYNLTNWIYAPDPGAGASGAWCYLKMTEDPSNETPKLVVPQSIVDAASSAPLIRYNRYLSGGAHTWGAANGGWQVTHALALATGLTGRRFEGEILNQIAYSLEGGNCISANGGYPSQHERHITGAYTILKNSDAWTEKLTQTQRDKITLLMKATLIACAYTTADKSNQTGIRALDGDTNLNRGWNPNFREGMFGGIVHATVFFGGVAAVEEILNNYDHDAFVAELESAGLSNTAETFNWAVNHPNDGAPTGTMIETNVSNYRLYGESLKDPMEQLYTLTMNTYNQSVNCGLNNGAGVIWEGVPTGTIVSGCETLPNFGAAGMLTEFNSSDANGSRSSATYAYDGFRPNLTNHLVVVHGGYWKSGAHADEILSRMNVGITDLYYKLEKGYRSYAKGKGSTKIFDLNTEDWSWSFVTTLPLWFDVLKVYHGLDQ